MIKTTSVLLAVLLAGVIVHAEEKIPSNAKVCVVSEGGPSYDRHYYCSCDGDESFKLKDVANLDPTNTSGQLYKFLNLGYTLSHANNSGTEYIFTKK